MAVKQSLSYYGATKTPNVSDLLIFGPSTIDVCSCKSKGIIKNKDSLTTTASTTTKKQNDGNPLISVASMDSIL